MTAGNKGVGAELIGIVRSYAEEFGCENILIAVPLEWETLGEALTANERTRLAFTTNGKIEVSAFEGTKRRLHYQVDAEIVLAEAMEEREVAA
jgi:hypothetical protein